MKTIIEQNRDDLRSIAQNLEIGSDGQLFFQKKRFSAPRWAEASPEARLLGELADLLYEACYTRGGLLEERGFSNEKSPIDGLFFQKIRAANASREGFDGGWEVEEIEQTGGFVLRKGGHRRAASAGDFVRETAGQGPISARERVRMFAPREHGSPSEPFYHVFGETILEKNGPALVRIYFNLRPERAADLVGLISRKLNRADLPFQFKCLTMPALFSRCDTAVLYLDRRHFSAAADLIFEENELQNWLRPAVPMFAARLADGVAFAENPFSETESFGTSRCKILAKSLAEAHEKALPRAAWGQKMEKDLAENGYPIDSLHLNPGSKYPYPIADLPRPPKS